MPSAKDVADTAANFGYSVAFFNSDPELKKLLGSAVSGNWTPAQFVAKLQATKWFRTHGEAARQVVALKTSDPATYNQRLASARQQIAQVAWNMGAPIPSAAMAQLSEHALTLGWTEDQIRSAVSGYLRPDRSGLYSGNAAQAQMQIKELATDYGYNLSTAQSGNWVKGMVTGQTTIEQVKQQIMADAVSRFPALKDRLVGGETLEQIAAPYKDSYSKILEVNPETIALRDPLLQRALSTKDQKGKPSVATVWQFEEDLRKDPRWLQTNNARDQLVGQTHKLLTDLGLAV